MRKLIQQIDAEFVERALFLWAPLLVGFACLGFAIRHTNASHVEVVASGERDGRVEYHVVAKRDLFESPDGICVFTVAGPGHVETVVLERCSVVRR